MLGGLYVHIPFCSTVCPYCDFPVARGDRKRRARFVERLLGEIELHAGCSLRFDTVYLGGGTPSSMAPRDLERILTGLAERLPTREDCRLFLEANPEDATPAALRAWRALGVHTLILGIQSLDDAALRYLGRGHDAAQGRRSIELARGAGFETVSIDLLYGLPDQSRSAWRRELEATLVLQPDHLSCYQLTESGSRDRRPGREGVATGPRPARAAADLFELTHTTLNAAGLRGYEVSHFATAPRHQSRHNVKYWNHTPYLGLGPSAHSYVDRTRWWNLRQLDRYERRIADGKHPVEGREELSGADLALEALMLGLRTYEGVDLARVESLCGLDLRSANAELIERLCAEGLLREEGRRLEPTLRGLSVADSLPPLFTIDPEHRRTQPS